MRGAKTTKRVERQLRISELQSTDLKCGVWAGRLLVLWGGEEAVASAAAPNLPNQSRRWARCGRSCGGCVRVNGQSSRVSLWGQCGWHIDLAHAPSPTRSQFWKWTWTSLAILVIELVMNMCPPLVVRLVWVGQKVWLHMCFEGVNPRKGVWWRKWNNVKSLQKELENAQTWYI